MQRFALLARALLARAQRTKVLGGLGCVVAIQAHHDAPSRLVVDRNVEKHARSDFVSRIVLRGATKTQINTECLTQATTAAMLLKNVAS